MAKRKVAKYTPSGDFLSKLKEWYETQEQVAVLQAKEHALRVALVTEGFDVTKLEGTETHDLGGGWSLKATKKQNYSLTNKQHETEHLLSLLGPHPEVQAGLVRWTPELSISTYRKLCDICLDDNTINAALAAALTIKPGMPELELVAPTIVEETK